MSHRQTPIHKPVAVLTDVGRPSPLDTRERSSHARTNGTARTNGATRTNGHGASTHHGVNGNGHNGNGTSRTHGHRRRLDEVTGPAPLPTVDLRGVSLHAITQRDCVQHILGELEAGRGGWVVTANLDHLRRLVRGGSFAELCSGSSLLVADGMPLIWASRLQGTPLPERVTGADLICSLSRGAARARRSVFLLGGNEGTAEGAADVLRSRFPRLQVVGTHCPPMGFENDPAEMEALTAAVVRARPEIVFLGLGSPKGELLVNRLRPLLPGSWWMEVGISFSLLTGEINRAPQWMQGAGLEWAHRLVQEPRRLYKRYLVRGIPFAVSLLGSVVVQRFVRPIDHAKPRAEAAARSE